LIPAHRLSGSFAATGTSDSLHVNGPVSISLDIASGPGSGTVKLERSFDDGSTWKEVEEWADLGYEGIIEEVAYHILYRFRCSAYTSGTIYYVLGV
jgi:hypothetical protein